MFKLFIPTNDVNYYNTQPHGYCSFLAIQQQYIHRIAKAKSINAAADYLTTILTDHHRPIWIDGMHQYLHLCLQAGLPKIGLTLQQSNSSQANHHQLLFQQWLHILAIWALGSDMLSRLLQSVFQQRQDYYDNHQYFPSSFPEESWPTTEDLAEFRLPFPVSIFVETKEYYGFQMLHSTNVTKIGHCSTVGPDYDAFTLSQVAVNTGYLLFSSSHFYWGGDSRPYSVFDVTEARTHLMQSLPMLPQAPPPTPCSHVTSNVSVSQNYKEPAGIPMREQIRRRRCDDYYFQTLPNRMWLIDYLKLIPPDSPIYPDDEVRAGFSDTLSWFQVIDSSEYGKEVIFLRDLPVNAFAFIYAGSPTHDSGEYIMRVQQFNIKPIFSDPYSFGSRCNEYIWSHTHNTVRHIEQGLVVTSQCVKQGQRAWLNYGTFYDWSKLINSYINNIIPVMQCLFSIKETNPPPWDDIVKACDQAQRSSSLNQLLNLFYHSKSDIDQPVEPLFSLMHNLNPTPGLTAEEWIEFMLRSRWTYSNFCFRRRDDPEGLYYPMYEVTKYNIPKRACTKIPVNVAYPYNSTRHLAVKLDARKRKCLPLKDSFSIAQLQDINSFNFCYQPLHCSTPAESSAWYPQEDGYTPTSQHSQPALSSEDVYDDDMPDINTDLSSRLNLQSHEHPQWSYERTDDNLRSLFFNLDGADISAIYDIIDIMEKQSVDVVCIVDPRLDDRHRSIQAVIRRKGLLIRVFYVPQASTSRKDERVGGVLFLTGPRLSKLKLERVCPEGSFSVLHGYFGASPVHFLGTYWPIFNSDSQSLWQRMNRRYQKHPIEAIQGKISSKLLAIHLKQETGFLFGDFNSDVTVLKKDKYNLAAFCQANWLLHSSTPNQLKSPSYGKQSIDGAGQSRIDYQFHNGFNVVLNRVSCFPSDLLHHIGSHRCLLASYYLIDRVQLRNCYKLPNSICNIDITNKEKIEKLKANYESLYDEVKDIQDPTEAINEITHGSVRVAKAVFTKQSRFRYNHFSPHATALHINLNFLRKISNGIYGSRAHAPWNNRAFKRSMKSIKVQWKKQLTKVLCRSHNAEVSLHEILTAHADCYGFLYWDSKTLNETKHVIGTAYKETKKRLHARRRRDMRKGFSDKVKSMEEQRIAGKLKNVITYVMGAKRKAYNFDELLVNGEPITDPKDIHTVITSHFQDWFKDKEDTGQASNDPDSYSHLKLPWPDFKLRFQSTLISEPLLLSLHSALNSGPSELKKQTMAETLSATPTISEFQAAIDHTKNGTAPGISGLSYSMIKLWPKTLIEFTFQQLLLLWKTHSFPAHWSDKWIAPIPKSADPTLESLRPIALLEVLRKLWVAIIIHRIQSLFQSGGYLHPSQHGCLRGVGTDEAVLEITNALEAAKEKQGDIYVASWDMRRAFDRVPKSFLIFAWLRMGVPLDIARYLVALDIDGSTIVKTPFAQSYLKQKGFSAKSDLDFTAETGCAQGDPQSAISWNCFIDILLVALHNKQDNKAHFTNHNGLQVPQLESAYVDDILSILYSSEDLQREADLVSAFTILSGMEISIPKLKAFRFNWGNLNLPGTQHFVVHTSGWTPHLVPLAQTGCFKYLGLWIDHNLSHQKQFDITKQQLLLLCDQITNAKITPESKLRLINASLFPKLIYATKFSSWFLAQYQELDRILNRAYRTITKLLPSTSSYLLNMKVEHGGLELAKLSTTINERKLKLLQRLDQQNSYRKSVVQSLVGRGARSQGHILPVGHGTTLTAPLSPWWITSLTQELSLNALSLTINGSGSDSFTSPNIYLWETSLTKNLNAATIQQGEAGVSLLSEISSSAENIPLRVGQCWLTSSDQSPQTLVEIIGFKDNYQVMDCLTWSFNDVNLSLGSVVLSHSSTQDPKYTVSHTFDSLFPPSSDITFVILDNAIYDGLNTRKLVKSIHRHSPIRPQAFIPSETIFDILKELGQDVKTIYTDGGWKKIPKPTDPLSHSINSGGAIVLRYENGSYGCIQLAVDLQVSSVYPVELLALAAARIIAKGSDANPAIHTDSKAALDTMVSISKGNIQNQYLQYLIAHESLYAPLNAHHVKSHVEKRKKFVTDWTQHETGNYIADNLTMHDWHRHQEAHIFIGSSTVPVSRIAGIHFSALLQALSQRNTFAITSMGLPHFHCLKTISCEKIKDIYILTRDKYRACRGARIKWAKRDLRTLKYTYPSTKSITEKALRMKIIFDKHWTSSNQDKYARLPTRQDLSPNNANKPTIYCQLCHNGEETQQHIIHLCTHRDMEQCRTDICTHINTQISQLKRQYPDYGNVLDTLRDIAYSPNNTYLWTGLWPKIVVRRMVNALRKLNLNTNFIMLLKLSRIFTQETKRLYQTRASILEDTNRIKRFTPIPKPSPSILNCFPRHKTKVSTRRNTPVNDAPKKTIKATQVVMRKITHYGFVPKKKAPPLIPVNRIKTRLQSHPDQLTVLTLDEIITQFRRKDVPFCFPNKTQQPHGQTPVFPHSEILTRFRARDTPFSFGADLMSAPKKRKRCNKDSEAMDYTPNCETYCHLTTHTRPPEKEENSTVFSKRVGVG